MSSDRCALVLEFGGYRILLNYEDLKEVTLSLAVFGGMVLVPIAVGFGAYELGLNKIDIFPLSPELDMGIHPSIRLWMYGFKLLFFSTFPLIIAGAIITAPFDIERANNVE